MKKVVLLIVVTFSMLCCKDPIRSVNLENIQGYWEIEYVIFPNASKKKYTLNNQIDYIHYKEGKGYLKKVQPTVEGRFQTSDVAMPFTIDASEEVYKLVFENGIVEIIEEVNQKTLVLRTLDNTSFHYLRHQPLNPFDHE
jgi:hypothetical protein